MHSDVVNDVSYAGLVMRGDILGLERRRRWYDEEKLEIVLSVGVGGATVTQVWLLTPTWTGDSTGDHRYDEPARPRREDA